MAYRQISPLPIINGGTNSEGLSNITYGTLYFDGTSYVTVNPGTSTYVLTSNGAAAPTFQPAAGAGSSIYPFSNTTGSTQAMVVNTGYVANDGASLVTFTLPPTASVGQVVAVQGAGTGLWKVAQNAGQSISFNAVTSTVGTGGSVSSMSQFDSIYLMCVIANTTWVVNNSVGDLSVI